MIKSEIKSEINTVRVIIYCRISSDPHERQAGVKRQEDSCRALCAQLSNERERWVVTRVVIDNDRSNSIARKREREQFSALLTSMEDGTADADAVVFFDQDRFVKDELEWARWVRSARQHPMRVAICGSGEQDVTSPDGYMVSVLRMLTANVATMMAVKRITAFTKDQATRGKSSGRVMYGWQRVINNDARGYKIDWHDEIDPDKAAIIRECTSRILKGDSTSRIARDLTERGVPVPSVGRKNEGVNGWKVPTITKMVARPANVGVKIDASGAETPLALPPILTRSEWERVCLILRDPARRTMTDNRISNLLSHLATCGKCGGPMRRKTIKRSSRATNKEPWVGYACSTGWCACIRKADADEYVIDVTLGYIAEHGLDAVPETDDAATRTMHEAAARAELLRAELDAHIYDNEQREPGDPLWCPKAKLDEHRMRLAPKIQQARRAATPVVMPGLETVYELAHADEPRTVWDRLSIERQRGVIGGLFTVVIVPADKTVNPRTVDLSRIKIARKIT